MKNDKMIRVLKRVGLLLLCMALIAPMGIFSVNAEATDFAGGSGTQADPYLIETKEQLNNVRNYLDAHFKLIADIVFTDADFALGGAFYNDGKGWAPIGDSYVNKFTGVFDGNGHVIKNLKIDYVNIEDSVNNCFGLFGYVDNATVMNIGLVGTSINAATESSVVGAVAGYLNNGIIENCYNTGNVSGYHMTGGIVGAGAGTIIGCYNTGNISNALGRVGGIVACFIGTVKNCYNKGNVHASEEFSITAAGIIGEIYDSIIENCYNSGNISVNTVSDAAVGGIIGLGDKSTVRYCYNTGSLSAEAEITYIGGIAGFSYSRDGFILTSCYYVNSSAIKGFGNLLDTETFAKKCTIDAMKKKATFEGFDFEKVWFINTNGEYLFPQLRNNSTDITERTLTSISVTKPTKLTYLEGESFDSKGMNVTANYDNGDSEKVTDYTVSGFNSTTGKKTITVSYNGKTATFTVTVEARPTSSEVQSEPPASSIEPPVSSTEPPASSETGSSEVESSVTPENSSTVDNLSSEINSSEPESTIVNDENNNIFNSVWLYVIVAISVVIGVTVGIVLKKKK